MYKLTNRNVIINTISGDSFPMDERNSDFIRYLKWVNDGNDPLPAQSLDEIKVEKSAEIEQQRDLECIKNVSALGTEWQADKLSQSLLSSTITLASAGLPLPPVWRDAFNNDVQISSINELLAIAGAMALQTQTAYAKSWAKKAAINAATTVDELSLISW